MSARGSNLVLRTAVTPATSATATTAFKAYGNSLNLYITTVTGGAGDVTLTLQTSKDGTNYHSVVGTSGASSWAITVNTAGRYEFSVPVSFIPGNYYKVYYACTNAAGTIAIDGLSWENPAGNISVGDVSVGDVNVDLTDLLVDTGSIDDKMGTLTTAGGVLEWLNTINTTLESLSINVDVSDLALESGGNLATIAGDTTSIDGKITACDTGSIAGTVTANAGTDLNTSLLALETGGNLATIAGDTTSIDGKITACDTGSIAGTVTANAGTDLNTSLLALESGGNIATIAGDTTSIDGKITACDTGSIAGTVTANAGTNLNTSALALETGGNLAGAATSLAIIDDWDNAASDGCSVSGDVAHDSADAGEPVKIGGVARSSAASAVSAADRVNAVYNLNGEAVVAGYDWATGKVGVEENNPISDKYALASRVDTTDVSAATHYYPGTTGTLVDGYRDISWSGKLIDADGTLTLTLEAMNDEDTTNGDWIDITKTLFCEGSSNAAYAGTTGNTSYTVTNDTLTFALSIARFNFSSFRLKVVATGATNTVIIKERAVY